jgi:hypothetical protein
MRPARDVCKDADVKLELFDRRIRRQCNVVDVFDDHSRSSTRGAPSG